MFDPNYGYKNSKLYRSYGRQDEFCDCIDRTLTKIAYYIDRNGDISADVWELFNFANRESFP